ncbi:hypothetical protein [Leptolyngbya sp. NIES-2104]|uniref:hypothetical protein n=1 Tax=Leptolyngbya sp. NIES-2104 TaxID=1552121 RepID=UPI000AE8A312|nr:hypothetical protein [Leptolyngbya sp. NIES-2104]
MSFSRMGLVALCLSAIGCSTSPNLPAASSNVITMLQPGERVKARDVGSKRDRVVQVEGKIKAQAPLAGGQRAYEVQDDSGSIWIVTTRSIPPVGSSVTVSGTVKLQKIDLAGQDQSTVYIEQQ